MPEVTYTLTVTVDDEIVFLSSYYDTVELQQELDKAEIMVERKLKEIE